MKIRTTFFFKKMAYAYPRRDGSSLEGDIIPTAIMIKHIPSDWKPDHMLRLMDQRRLPSPTALKYLYDDHLVFRSMAFAEFASSGDAWRVIQDLNYYRVCGQRLKVQPKRKRQPLTSREDTAPVRLSQSNPNPGSDTPDTAYPPPQTKSSPAARSTREPTPPSESYNLLMSYQTNPVEKEKLKRFLEQTGDYQEAVNEFAKNRARETQAGEHGWCTEDGTIMEKRPPTLGEQMQVEQMENEMGFGGEVSSSGSLIGEHREEQDFAQGIENGLRQGTRVINWGKSGGSLTYRGGHKGVGIG